MDDGGFDHSIDLMELDVRPRIAGAVGFIGNCQAEVLQRAFRRAVSASRLSSFYHYFEVPDSQRESARADLARCDVLLMQDIQDLETYPLRDSIPRTARIVQFPFLRFASPWPYDDFNGLRDSAARAQDDPAYHTKTHYDGFLGRLRRLTLEPQARFEAYRSAQVPGMIDPLRVHDFEVRRLEALDARFGCAIGRAILDGFRASQLFYTVNRPCGALLAMVLEHIFKALGLALPRTHDDGLDELRSIEVPVHPFVARRLGMEWAEDDRLYNVDGGRKTWEGFVRGYIARYG